MDFTNKNLAVLFEVGGTKFYLTQTLLATWIVMGLLILFAVVVRIKLLKFREIPAGFQNVVEIMVETMDRFTISTMGSDYRHFGGFFFGVFAFVICANYSGLLGLRPPTADVATTGALAVTIFVITHVTGIKRRKLGYLKSFIEPNPIFLPINLIGEVSNVLSLCFRLFGNMLGGVIILGLAYEMFPVILKFVVPSALHAYFDIFAGALQAFIFTVLSMTFIMQKGSKK